MARSINTDPLRNFKFNVFIPWDGGAGPMSSMGFMSVTGLGAQTETITYREGGDNTTTRKMPGQTDFPPIVLSRGLFHQDYQLWYWLRHIFFYNYGQVGRGSGSVPIGNPGYGTTQDFRRDFWIQVLQHPVTEAGPGVGGQAGWDYPAQTGLIARQFKIFNAWPSSLQISDFDAGGNAVAVEQMTLQYEGFDQHSAGPLPGTW